MKTWDFCNYGKNLPSFNTHTIAQILRKTGMKAWASTLPPAKKSLSVTLQALYTSKLTKKPGLFRKQAASNATLLLCQKSHLKLTGGLSRNCSQNPWLFVRCSFLCWAIQYKLPISLSGEQQEHSITEVTKQHVIWLAMYFFPPILTSRSAFISLSESLRLW